MNWLLAAVLALATFGEPGTTQETVPQVLPPPLQVQPDGQVDHIPLVSGRSRVMLMPFDVVRLAVTNPAVADAAVVQRREVLIDGKSAGSVSLILWGAAPNERLQFDIDVTPAESLLQQQLRAVFPSEDIHVASTEESIVLTGHVSANEVALRAAELAQASASKMKIINLLEKPEPNLTKQVLLECRFAEVEHDALVQLGASFLANRPDFAGRVTTQQFSAPSINDATPAAPIVIPDYLNLFFFLRKEGLLALIKALKQRGLFQSLAEPNLIAYSGQEASFLAGGEFPIPIVNGNTGNVTIVFKEFGVRLNFLPTVAGDLIRLKVKPEVSSLDYSNGLVLGGYRVPALKTRRAETDVELRDGQSFAIAGLLDNESTEDHQSIPFLSAIPIVGTIFKSKSDSNTRTELLVLITPHLVGPLEPSQIPPLPGVAKPVKPGDGLGSELDGGGGLVDPPATAPPKVKKP